MYDVKILIKEGDWMKQVNEEGGPGRLSFTLLDFAQCIRIVHTLVAYVHSYTSLV